MIRPHLTHLSVQCSKPGRAAIRRWTSMGDWHLGQRGRVAARYDRVGVCGPGNRCLPWNAAGALPSSLSPMKCHWRSGDVVVCAAPGAGCWSILLSLGKLRGRRASARSRVLTAIIGGDHALLGRLEFAAKPLANAGLHWVLRYRRRLNTTALLALKCSAVEASGSRLDLGEKHSLVIARRAARPLNRRKVGRGDRLIFAHGASCGESVTNSQPPIATGPRAVIHYVVAET